MWIMGSGRQKVRADIVHGFRVGQGYLHSCLGLLKLIVLLPERLLQRRYLRLRLNELAFKLSLLLLCLPADGSDLEESDQCTASESN